MDFLKKFKVALTLSWRDFRVRYIGSKAGYLWVFLTPSLYSLIFLVLRSKMSGYGVEINTEGVHPAFYAFAGVVIWQLWFETLISQIDCVRHAHSILRAFRAPIEIFFMSKLLVSFYDAVVRMLLIFIVALFFKVNFSYGSLLMPVFFLISIFTANVLGLILAFPGTLFSDVKRTLTSLSLGIMLLSPIFYKPTSNPESPLYYVNIVNPIASTIATTRDFLIGGDLMLLFPALTWFIILAPCAVILIHLLNKALPILIERV